MEKNFRYFEKKDEINANRGRIEVNSIRTPTFCIARFGKI
jgi:hypothetical protein